MKLTKCIINPSMNLIGFLVKGKANEFGEMSRNEVERPVDLKYLMRTNFSNSQVTFSKDKILEKSGFHLNQLGLIIASGDTMQEVPNTISLTKRFVRNNENIGFEVKFGNGNINNYKYEDVLKLTELFNPQNFVVRINASGKQFIAGKSGFPLSKLPVEVIEETSNAKKTKSGARPVSPVTGTTQNYVDIIDLFDFVKKCNGFIINFPNTKYNSTGDTITKADDRFKPLGIGEIASPVLEFNETKFNASCKFKNPGVVNIDGMSPGPVFVGVSNVVYTFIYRTKNIFHNCEHHLTRIGIVIPEENTHELFEQFSSSMAITEMKDEKTAAIIDRLINWKGSKIFEVDTSKLALIAPEKYAKYIMNSEELYKTTSELASCKIALKYIRGSIKEINEVAGIYTAPKNRPIAPQFALKSEKELNSIIEAGIDIYTGAFTDKGETIKNTASKPTASDVEVSYIIDGKDPKNFTYAKMKDDSDKIPTEVYSLISKVSAEEDIRKRLESLTEVQNKLEKAEWLAKRKLWMHKTSMYLKNNKLGVHKDDSSEWEINTKKRTKAICYDCTNPKANGLQLLVLNTDVLK